MFVVIIPLASYSRLFSYINRVQIHLSFRRCNPIPPVFFRRVQALYVVLARYAIDEQLRICLSGERHGVNHQFEQGTDDAETGEVQCPVHRVNGKSSSGEMSAQCL